MNAIIIIISRGLRERNARNCTIWRYLIMSEENRCTLDDTRMTERIKTTVTDTVKNSSSSSSNSNDDDDENNSLTLYIPCIMFQCVDKPTRSNTSYK